LHLLRQARGIAPTTERKTNRSKWRSSDAFDNSTVLTRDPVNPNFRLCRGARRPRGPGGTNRSADRTSQRRRSTSNTGSSTYTVHWRLREGVLTYLGRAYYETGKYEEARRTLEKALAHQKDDHIARLYLGLTALRSGDRDRGRQDVESGLRGIHAWLDYVSSDELSGIYWDPGRQIRTEIQTTLSPKLADPEFIASAQRIGSQLDEEIEKARRDEARTRYGRGGNS
jgi:tetratricopeptide (TPR) repeat protein